MRGRLCWWIVPVVWLSGCGRVGFDLLPLPEVATDDGGALPNETDGEAARDGRAATCAEDADQDSVCDASDQCPGFDDLLDADADGTPDGCDLCPNDAAKIAPGVCACDVIAPPTPTGHWRFDETSGTLAVDQVSGHNGTLVNTPANAWTAGKVGGAVAFDGADDRIDMGATSNGVRALSFWLQAKSFGLTTTETPWLNPSSTGPKNEWTNPENAFLQDGRNATAASLLFAAKEQDWGGFGIRMPSTTRGIEVRFNSGSVALLGYASCELSWNAGSGITNTKETAGSLLQLGANITQYGGPTTTWSRSWPQSELSNANFRVRIHVGGLAGTGTLDYVALKVYYDSFTDNRTVLALSPTARVELSGPQLSTIGFPAGSSVYVDGAAGTAIDNAWHHVVITTPTALDVSALRIAGDPGAVAPFEGAIDDLRLFDKPLSVTDANTLYTAPGCVQ